MTVTTASRHAGGFPGPAGTQPVAQACNSGHRYSIVTTTRTQPLSARSSRRYPAWAAAAALLITMAGVVITAVALLQATAAQADYRDGLLTSISYAVPCAVTEAFPFVRRPDLPFGWLLSGAALLAAVGSATAALVYLAVSHGASERLALIGYATSATAVLPLAVQGLVNVRFPSGRLGWGAGRVLEIALIAGIVLVLVAGVLGDYKLRLVRPDSTVEQVGNPLTGGTALGRYAADLSVIVPVVVLLGLIAGVGVLRRAWKANRYRALPAALARLRRRAVAGPLPARGQPGPADRRRRARRPVLRDDAGHPRRPLPAVGHRHGDPAVGGVRAGDDRGGGRVRGDRHRRGRNRGGEPSGSGSSWPRPRPL